MSISREKIKFTYQDYLHLPDDGRRYQVIEGIECLSLEDSLCTCLYYESLATTILVS